MLTSSTLRPRAAYPAAALYRHNLPFSFVSAGYPSSWFDWRSQPQSGRHTWQRVQHSHTGFQCQWSLWPGTCSTLCTASSSRASMTGCCQATLSPKQCDTSTDARETQPICNQSGKSISRLDQSVSTCITLHAAACRALLHLKQLSLMCQLALPFDN